MPNKIQKFLQRLDAKHHALIVALLTRIAAGNFDGLAMKKLGGVSNRYRVRKGNVRILFSLDEKGRAVEIEVARRTDTTYNF